MIVKGFRAFIEDYWVNKLYLEKPTQKDIKKDMFNYINNWFVDKKVDKIRIEIPTSNKEDTLFWESLGFQTFKWIMYK